MEKGILDNISGGACLQGALVESSIEGRRWREEGEGGGGRWRGFSCFLLFRLPVSL